nr:unnamed protein product [Haemonchus contortus]
MRYAPANYAPKFDPVTMFSRDEVLELLRQKEIDAEKGNNSKAKALLIWNSTYPDYLPTCLRSIMLKEWTDSYLNARNSGKTKVEACYAVYNQHVLEMDPHTLHGEQTRLATFQDKKLEKDFIAAMRNVFAPIGHERRDTVSVTSMAEKVDFHIPLCSIVTIDKHGYVTQVNVLKAPVNMKSKENRAAYATRAGESPIFENAIRGDKLTDVRAGAATKTLSGRETKATRRSMRSARQEMDEYAKDDLEYYKGGRKKGE